MIEKILNSFSWAMHGFKTAWQEEHNFRIEIIVGILVIIAMFLFKFSWIESAFCVFAIVLVLSAEIVNTAVEDLCNKVEPAHDPIIAKIKDTMATFVLISSLGAFIIGCIVFWHHFFGI